MGTIVFSTLIKGALTISTVTTGTTDTVSTRSPDDSFPTAGNTGCPKCGATRKSGTLSCCARGGAWFKKCGDVGDTRFDYTWAGGIQICKSGSCGETECCVITVVDIASLKTILLLT